MKEQMKIKEILSSDLPFLNGATRDLINYGRWFLYLVDFPQNQDVIYVLSTNDKELMLSAQGQVIGDLPKNSKIRYKNIINFKDIPRPEIPNSLKILWT